MPYTFGILYLANTNFSYCQNIDSNIKLKFTHNYVTYYKKKVCLFPLNLDIKIVLDVVLTKVSSCCAER